MRQVFDSFATFDDFAAYLGVALALFGLFVAIYVRITPYREITLIREGNMAAAYSLSGAMAGFVVPLAAAIHNSVNLVDMAIWGGVAMAVQIAAFVATRLLVPTITRDIPEGKAAQGWFLGAFALSVGLLNAACMSY